MTGSREKRTVDFAIRVRDIENGVEREREVTIKAVQQPEYPATLFSCFEIRDRVDLRISAAGAQRVRAG